MSPGERCNPAQEILQVIPKVMRILASEIRQEPGGLAPAHFRLMYVVAKEPKSLTELARSQSVSLATMSNSITVLVERGWVARRKDPKDRRRLSVEITPDGREVLNEVHANAERRLEQLLSVMSEEQCQDIMKGLELLNSVFTNQVRDDFVLGNEE